MILLGLPLCDSLFFSLFLSLSLSQSVSVSFCLSISVKSSITLQDSLPGRGQENVDTVKVEETSFTLTLSGLLTVRAVTGKSTVDERSVYREIPTLNLQVKVL